MIKTMKPKPIRKKERTELLLLIIMFVFLINGHQLNGQDPKEFVSFANFTPPSPEMTMFQKYGDIPVELSSGIPSVQIPIFEISSGSLRLPVNLSYHCSGIKVEELPSCVGLGWILNSGGSISRNILGKPDEIETSGFLNISQFLTREELNNDPQYDGDDKYSKLVGYSQGYLDTQSDEYYLNIPGISLRFLYDTNKVIHTDAVDRMIIIDRDLTNNKFKVIDDAGVSYYFDEIEYTLNQMSGHNSPTAWLLTKIVSFDLQDSIVFRYKNADSYSDYYVSSQMIISETNTGELYENCGESTLEPHLINSFGDYTYTKLLIDSINFNLGSLVFVYEKDTADLVVDQLKEIKLVANQQTKKHFKFSQSHFISGCPQAGKFNERLRLDRIDCLDNLGIDSLSYSFGYNSLCLPAYRAYQNGNYYKSIEYDYWGYYNGNGALLSNNNTLIPDDFENDIINYATSKGFNASPIVNLYETWSTNRNADPNYASACSLQKITYPTGGFNKLEYEGNKANSAGPYLGGLRIKGIDSFDKDSTLIKSEYYKYGEGEQQGILMSKLLPLNYFYIEPKFLYKCCNLSCFLVSIYPYSDFIATSSSNAPINFYNGSPVFYPLVTLYEGNESSNNGRTKYYFNYDSDKENIYDALRYGTVGTSKSWIRGQLISKKTYNSDGTLLKEVKNTYAIRGQKTITAGFLCEQKVSVVNLGLEAFIALTYPQYTDKYLTNYFELIDLDYDFGSLPLIRTEENDYTQDTVKKVTSYYYNSSDHPYMTRKICSLSSNDSLSYDFRYSLEKDSITGLNSTNLIALDSLIAKNNLSKIIEVKEHKDNVFTQRTVLGYETDNLGFPRVTDKMWQTQNTNLGSEVQLGYYSSGREYYQKGKDNIYELYLWGYSNSRIVALLKSHVLGDMAYTGFETEADYGGWNLNSGTLVTVCSKTGENSGISVVMSKIVTTNSILSLWAKIENTLPYVSGYTPIRTYTASDGWTYFEWEVAPPTITITGGDSYIDEVRLYPVGGLMTTFTYDPLIGMTSQTDPNGFSQYYEYDSFGRLMYIRDHNSKILRNFKYHYND